MWATLCMRCMPAVLRRLYHYISARQAVGSACDLLFYITALPSILFWTLLQLSPHTTSSPLCSSPCSPRSALLFGFLCQPVQFRAILTDSQTLSGGAGWCAHYRNRLLAHMKVLSEHPTVALIRKTKACMWSDSYCSTYKHVWDVNKKILPRLGGPICKIYRDLMGNA